MHIRTLRKLSGNVINKNILANKVPHVFEDVFTGEKFVYTLLDTSVFLRAPIGSNVLATMDKSWARHREKLEDDYA